MAKSTRKLTQRKAELLVQSALLREKLAVEILSTMQMPDFVMKGLNIWNGFRRVRKKPLFIGTLALAFLAIKPRRLISWLVSATVLFKTWRRFSPIVVPLIGFLARRKR